MAQYTPNKNIPSIYRPKVMEGSVEQDAIENHESRIQAAETSITNHENRIQKTESHVDFNGPADSTHHAHLAKDIWVESYDKDDVTHTAATVQAFVDQCHVNLSTHSKNKNTSAVHLTDTEKTNVNNHVQNTGIHFTNSTEKQNVNTHVKDTDIHFTNSDEKEYFLTHTKFTRKGEAPNVFTHNATEIHISRQPGVLPASGLSGRLTAMQNAINASRLYATILEPVTIDENENPIRSTIGQFESIKKIANNLISQVYTYTLNGQTITPAILKWNLWKATITEELYEYTGYVYQISPDRRCPVAIDSTGNAVKNKMDLVIYTPRNFVIRRLLCITVDGDFEVRPVGKLYECSDGTQIIDSTAAGVSNAKSQYRVHLTTDEEIGPYYPDGFVIKIVAIGEFIPVYCWKNSNDLRLYTISETVGAETVTYMSNLGNSSIIPGYGIAALIEGTENAIYNGMYNAFRCWTKKYYIKSCTASTIEVYPNAIDDNVVQTVTTFSRYSAGDLKPHDIEFDENVLS